MRSKARSLTECLVETYAHALVAFQIASHRHRRFTVTKEVLLPAESRVTVGVTISVRVLGGAGTGDGAVHAHKVADGHIGRCQVLVNHEHTPSRSQGRRRHLHPLLNEKTPPRELGALRETEGDDAPRRSTFELAKGDPVTCCPGRRLRKVPSPMIVPVAEAVGIGCPTPATLTVKNLLGSGVKSPIDVNRIGRSIGPADPPVRLTTWRQLPAIAVPLAVAMLNVTPPTGAGDESLRRSQS